MAAIIRKCITLPYKYIYIYINISCVLNVNTSPRNLNRKRRTFAWNVKSKYYLLTVSCSPPFFFTAGQILERPRSKVNCQKKRKHKKRTTPRFRGRIIRLWSFQNGKMKWHKRRVLKCVCFFFSVPPFSLVSVYGALSLVLFVSPPSNIKIIKS